MILETDQVLAGLLKAKALGGAAIGIAFDQPSRAWIQSVTTPTLNLFLFDVRENTHRRDVMYEEVRDAAGALVARRPPPRRFDLHYTVTAWAPKALVEHKLLGIALRCFAAFDMAPRELLPPPLAELPYEVLLTTGAGIKRAMFLNLAGDMKAGFEVTVTVPLPPLTELLAPPVVQEPARIEVKPMPEAGAGAGAEAGAGAAAGAGAGAAAGAAAGAGAVAAATAGSGTAAAGAQAAPAAGTTPGAAGAAATQAPNTVSATETVQGPNPAQAATAAAAAAAKAAATKAAAAKAAAEAGAATNSAEAKPGEAKAAGPSASAAASRITESAAGGAVKAQAAQVVDEAAEA